jgi:hypothetical protein
MLNVRQAETRGGPYRVALRAGQLEELSRNYHLAIVARGEVVVQFHALGDQAPLTADAKEREILLRKAGLNSEFAAGTQIAAQNAAAAAAVPGAGAPAPTGPVSAAPAAPAVSAAAPAAAAPVLTGRSQIAVQDKDAPVTIDCVITMEPAPAAAPGAAPGARTPAP